MTNSEMDVLMLHCIRSAELRKQAISHINENPFSEIMNPVHNVMWQVLTELNTSVPGSDIPLMIMTNELAPKLTALDSFRDYNLEAAKLLSFCYNTPSNQISVPIGMEMIKRVKMTQAKSKIVEFANKIYSPEDIDSLINLAKGSFVVSDDEETMIEPFMDIEKHLTNAPIVPTGVMPLDKVAGGGMTTGTVNGFLGPTGGGKTMMAMQIVTSQAKEHKHVLGLTYEQPIGGDVTHRIASRCLEVHIEELRKEYKDWSKEHQAKYMELRPKLGPYMHMEDMTKKGRGCRGIVDIEEAYNKLLRRDEAPTYIILDWLKPCIDRYLVHMGIDVTPENFRSHASILLDQLGQFVQATGTIVIVNHQLGTHVARMSPKKKPVVTDAMEFKGFSFNIDACFLLGNRDKETNITWLLTDKNRRAAVDDMLVQMDGEYAQFKHAVGYTADHRGKFVEEGKINVIPVDDGPISGGLSAGYL